MTEEKDTYIESVADYLNTLPQNQEFFDTLLDKLTLFRGQGNKEWDLMPSVMRNREDYLNEELYIKECIRQYPEEFINMSKIDIRDNMKEMFDNLCHCKYHDCLHINEDGCFIIELVKQNKILKSRYENYIKFIIYDCINY